MHELSVLKEMVRTVEKSCEGKAIERVETIVLEVGEMSSFLPDFARAVFPQAVEGTLLEGSELKMNCVPAVGKCRECGREFPLKEFRFCCPDCSSFRIQILQGRDVFVREIMVQEAEDEPLS